MKTYFVYVTCSSKEEARMIARAVVGEKLAACANIMPGMEAIYVWEGAVTEDEEVVLVFKTAKDRLAPLRERVTELHSYELPCVIALEIADGSSEYLAWLVAESRPKSVVGGAPD